MSEVTGTVKDDGALEVKDGETVIRYVKESDLLAVKGGKEAAEKSVKTITAEKEAALAEANTKAETAKQARLQAEALVESLTEKVKNGSGTAAELADAKQKLVAAETSSKEMGNSLLTARRELIVKTYNIPVAAVEGKNLTELATFEEALKAVIGSGKPGNYAFGGGGGAASLSGKSPLELARMAYDNKK
ncbi:MAG: hypothetical protein M0R06_00225 [Sphaerochaeta sp.]|jgi:hypothetical protein|nr:hypothetical protein [Sphaerochaeta sp.]